MNINRFFSSRSKSILISIVVIAAILRLFLIDQIPPGVNRDEASIGITAYSLLQTGRDEYDRYLPLSFQSFGDWKLPLYIYITTPFVAIFGLNELAVRLPSAIAGTLTVLITYLLVKELFASRKLGLLTSLLLAISPWHIHLSRVESESNIAVFFITTGTLFFLKAIKRQPIFYIPSAILFALTYYTYHGNHVFTTLFLTGLLFLRRHTLPKTKYFIAGIVVFVTLVGIILSKTFFEADKTKIAGISIFGNPAIIHEKIELPRSLLSKSYPLLAKIIYNRVTFATYTITKNYIYSFGPEFLFFRGGTNHAHNIENFGNLYLVEAPFFYLGILLLILKRKSNPTLILWWLLIAPIAGSITKDAPHTNRMFAIYPVPPILTALGIAWVYEKIKTVFTKKIFISVTLICFILNFYTYLYRYFIEFPKNESIHWGLGYKHVTTWLNQGTVRQRNVIISHPEYSPYAYILFYSGFDPLTYQVSVKRYPPTDDGFVHVSSFDRYQFKQIDWVNDLSQNSILVDFYDEIPEHLQSRTVKLDQFGIIF